MIDQPPVSFQDAVARLKLTIPIKYAAKQVSHYNPAQGSILIDDRIGAQAARDSVGWYILAHELFHNAQKQRGDKGFNEDEADRFGKWYGPILQRQALGR